MNRREERELISLAIELTGTAFVESRKAMSAAQRAGEAAYAAQEALGKIVKAELSAQLNQETKP